MKWGRACPNQHRKAESVGSVWPGGMWNRYWCPECGAVRGGSDDPPQERTWIDFEWRYPKFTRDVWG